MYATYYYIKRIHTGLNINTLCCKRQIVSKHSLKIMLTSNGCSFGWHPQVADCTEWTQIWYLRGHELQRCDVTNNILL